MSESSREIGRFLKHSGIYAIGNALNRFGALLLLPSVQRRLIDAPRFRRSRPGIAAVGTPSATSLPLYGRIAAGLPIEALADTNSMIEVPGVLLGSGEHYVLQVVGESMIEAGIHDGDYAVVQRCEDADTGDIVVALVEDREVTLKRLRRKGASIALEPANPKFEIRIFGPHQVTIQGRMVGLLRRY